MRYSFALLVKLKNKRLARTRITFSLTLVPYSNDQRAYINSSTLCYDSGVVLRPFYGRGLPETQNQYTSLIGAGMASNPNHSNF